MKYLVTSMFIFLGFVSNATAYEISDTVVEFAKSNSEIKNCYKNYPERAKEVRLESYRDGDIYQFTCSDFGEFVNYKFVIHERSGNFRVLQFPTARVQGSGDDFTINHVIPFNFTKNVTILEDEGYIVSNNYIDIGKVEFWYSLRNPLFPASGGYPYLVRVRVNDRYDLLGSW